MAGLRGNNADRRATMNRLRFRKVRPYIGGKQIPVWYRGPETLPKHIERDAVRYMVGKTSDGRPRVTIQAGGAP
jgi:hypothetical protein